MKKLLEPKITFNSLCIRCGYCARICPASAIKMQGKDTPPVVDHKKCIRCYCCHELCPSAGVDIKRFFLMNLLAPGKIR